MPSREEIDALFAENTRLAAERETTNRDRVAREQRVEQEIRRAAVNQANEANLSNVQYGAQQLTAWRNQWDWFSARRQNWRERNHQYKNLDAVAIAGNVAWAVSPIGLGVIDTLVLSVAAREVAKAALPLFGMKPGEGEWIIAYATVALASAWIFIEVCTGHKLNGERRSGAGRTTGLRPFSVAMAAALPILVIGFSLVNSGIVTAGKALGPSTLTAAVLRAGGLGLVAILTHGFALMMGGQIMNGTGYVLYKLHEIRLRRRIDRIEARINAETVRVETSFRGFYNGVNRRDDDDNGEDGTGPFGATTRGVVNDIFDDVIIEEPARRRGNDAAASRDHRPAAGASSTGAIPGEWDREDSKDGPAETDHSVGTGPEMNYNMDGEDEIRR